MGCGMGMMHDHDGMGMRHGMGMGRGMKHGCNMMGGTDTPLLQTKRKARRLRQQATSTKLKSAYHHKGRPISRPLYLDCSDQNAQQDATRALILRTSSFP